MKLAHEFEVTRPLSAVWAFFQDIPAVAQCLPGAELTEEKGGGVYGGKLSVKLGPMSAIFEGEAVVIPDADAHSATIDGKGVDRRGGSRGQVTVHYHLTPADIGTAVGIDADVTLSGAVAQFGRTGLINEMTTRLIDQFVVCLEAKLDAPTAEAAAEIENPTQVKGLSFFFASLWSWIKRLLRRR